MAVLLLDTNIVSYLFKGHTLAAKYQPHLQHQVPAVSFMTVAEMYEGAFRAKWGAKRFAKLNALWKNYAVFESTPTLCRRWGEVRFERKSQPIDGADAWIAATALVYGLPLVTHNPNDFAGIAGLTIITEVGP